MCVYFRCSAKCDDWPEAQEVSGDKVLMPGRWASFMLPQIWNDQWYGQSLRQNVLSPGEVLWVPARSLLNTVSLEETSEYVIFR